MAGPIKIPVELAMKMGGAVGGAAAGGAGGAARGAAGMVTGAPGQAAAGMASIAKQLPGVGLIGDMTTTFMKGGPIAAGMGALTGILGFTKQILEGGKVFQAISGTFFKIFTAMGDLFLMPFMPLAMKGIQMLLPLMPKFGEWGQKAADGLNRIIEWISSRGFVDSIKDGFAIVREWWTKTAWPNIRETTSSMASSIGAWWLADGWPAVSTWWSNTAWPEIWKGIEGIGGILSNAFQAFGEKFLGWEAGDSGSEKLLKTGATIPDEFLNNIISELPGLEGKNPNVIRSAISVLPTSSGPEDEWVDPATLGEHGRTRRQQMKDRQNQSAFPGPPMRQLGGTVPGGPGQGVDMTLHGGEEIVPRDIVAAMQASQGNVMGGFFGTLGESIQQQSEEINTYVKEFQTQEIGSGGALHRWHQETLEGDLPQIWTAMHDHLKGIGTAVEDTSRVVEGLKVPEFDMKLNIPEIKAPTDQLKEVEDCFAQIQACINSSLMAMPESVNNSIVNLNDIITNATNLIAQGRGDEVDFQQLWDALNGMGSGVSQHIRETTQWINSGADKIHSIMGMNYEEFTSMDEGLFGAATYFGTSSQQMGTYLTTMGELAGSKIQRPCTASQIEDPGNERCWGGCQGWMTETKGHPCYVPKPKKDPVVPVVPQSVGSKTVEDRRAVETDDWDEEVVAAVVEALQENKPDDQFAGISTLLNTESDAGFSLGAANSVATREQTIQAVAATLHTGGGTLPGPMGAAPDLAQSMEMLGITSIGSSGVMNFAFDPDEFYSGGIVPGRQGASRLIRAHGGERIMPNSSPGSGGGMRATSNRTMNVTINARGGVSEILGELERFGNMDDASFFNSV